MRSWRLLLIPVLLFCAQATYANPSGARAVPNAIRVYAPGCNAVAFTQVPDILDLFVGRQLNNTDPQNGCSGTTVSLVLLRIDWPIYRFTKLQTILQTPTTIPGGRRIDRAYDPYIIKFRDEYWVAFECAGKGIPGTSTCMGPFDPRQPTKGIDLARTYVVVYGQSADPGDKFFYSASDPKFLVYENRLYIYWTAIKYWYPPGTKLRQWVSSTVRGMELVHEREGEGLLWGRGADGPVASYDPARNVEVWGVDPADPRSNQTVDMFSLAAIRGAIYATAGLGGSGCPTPAGTSSGCYRLAIAVSTVPLGVHVFNQHLVPEEFLPPNPQEYTRFFQQPNGGFCLMGLFLKPRSEPAPEGALPEGLYCILLTADHPILAIGELLARSARR